MPRRFPIVQFPNRTMIVAMLAAAVARATDGETARRAGMASELAMLIWSGREIASGANWFRRLLGLAGGARSVAALKRLWTFDQAA